MKRRYGRCGGSSPVSCHADAHSDRRHDIHTHRVIMESINPGQFTTARQPACAPAPVRSPATSCLPQRSGNGENGRGPKLRVSNRSEPRGGQSPLQRSRHRIRRRAGTGTPGRRLAVSWRRRIVPPMTGPIGASTAVAPNRFVMPISSTRISVPPLSPLAAVRERLLRRVSPGRGAPAMRRPQRRRLSGSRYKGPRCAAASCSSAPEYDPTRPTPRRILRSPAHCTKARRKGDSSGRSAE
jgi:hypothetical protein